MSKIDAIILAAGSSRRMTGHKQLLTYQGKSLIEQLVEKLQALPLSRIICVTGLLNDELQNVLNQTSVIFVHNSHHLDGMGSSLKVGIRKVLQDRASDGALVCLTDQPLIPTPHYAALIEQYDKSDHSIIASAYSDTAGPPILFRSDHYQHILDLPTGKSAKAILKQYPTNIYSINCPEASRDIDTDHDYNTLISS